MMSGFRQFILRGNVIDLAVAVVIGGAFGAVVTALVKDLLTPLIGALVGTPDFSALVLHGQRQPVSDWRLRQRGRLVRAGGRGGVLRHRRAGERDRRAPQPRRGAARSHDEEVSRMPERGAGGGAAVRLLHVAARLSCS